MFFYVYLYVYDVIRWIDFNYFSFPRFPLLFFFSSSLFYFYFILKNVADHSVQQLIIFTPLHPLVLCCVCVCMCVCFDLHSLFPFYCSYFLIKVSFVAILFVPILSTSPSHLLLLSPILFSFSSTSFLLFALNSFAFFRIFTSFSSSTIIFFFKSSILTSSNQHSLF